MTDTDTREQANSHAAQGMEVVSKTQAQLILRRFFRHKAAMFGLVIFGGVVLLAISSIGMGPIPGWWDKPFDASAKVVNGGAPTLSIIPEFLGGDGLRWGEHPFGQDTVGKDYFALTMRGAQQSIMIALMVGIVATVLGSVLGGLAGYFRGWVESVIMRLTDVVIAFPALVVGAVIAKMVGNMGVVALGLFLGMVVWVTIARLVRGEFLSLREKEFVEAARAIGTPSRRIIFKHIMPNTVGVIIVSATLMIATAVLLETALSFLGFGVQPPDTSLGQLINQYRTAMETRPWLFWWPAMFIVLIALSVNFIGDGLRDAFDPRQTKVRQ